MLSAESNFFGAKVNNNHISIAFVFSEASAGISGCRQCLASLKVDGDSVGTFWAILTGAGLTLCCNPIAQSDAVEVQDGAVAFLLSSVSNGSGDRGHRID